MSEYKHGIYAETLQTQELLAPGNVPTLPVYIGRAAVHRLEAARCGEPVLIASEREARRILGYSTNWTRYELSEAVFAQFLTSAGAVGPFVAINVLDTQKHVAENKESKSLMFVRGRCSFSAPDMILSTAAIEGKELGSDFTVEANDAGMVTVTDLTGELAEVTMTYSNAAPESVTEEEVVEAIRRAVPLIYARYNRLPTVLCAPGWSCKAAVAEAMLGVANKINGHWDAFCNLDLPADAATATLDQVLERKRAGASGVNGDMWWPMGLKEKRKFRLSVLATTAMQATDNANGGVPYECVSNKAVDISGVCLADGTPVEFDEETANDKLNRYGINTAVFSAGRWVLWGVQTSAYEYGVDIDPKDAFEGPVRMRQYLTNSFQRRYGAEVDKPMRRSRVETICNDYQAFLDGLITDGALLHGGISFVETSNSVSDMVAGNFVFDGEYTAPAPGRSITLRLRWTSEGFDTLFGGEG